MSFYTGTQMELLYSMPANGTAVTAAAQTQLTGTPTASNPSYQLPAYFFPNGQGGPGKTLLIKASGFFTTGTITSLTDVIELSFDSTINTHGTTIAKTGAITGTTLTSVTNGIRILDCWITCQQVGTTTNLVAAGQLNVGTGNNAATVANAAYNIGTPQTPATINNATAYFIELWNTWSVTTGSPTITCSQFMIFGCN